MRRMAEAIKANGSSGKCMGKGSMYLVMETDTKVNLRRIKGMVMGFITGRICNMKDFG